MPLKSKAQERFLWANDPALAREFENKTTKSEKAVLPERAGKKRTRKKKDTKTEKDAKDFSKTVEG